MKKELKKKGFTLVELLAVIVVLAVIALITTPIILNVMDKAKKGALEDSAYGLLESANIYYAEGTLENNIAKTEFTFKDGVQTSENKLSYKGKIENGSVRLYSDGKSALCITGGNYAAVKNVNDKKVSVVKGRCSYNTETEEYETNGICQDLQDELDHIKGLGDATPEDILKGKTAVVKGQLVTGLKEDNSEYYPLYFKGNIQSGYQFTVSSGVGSTMNISSKVTVTIPAQSESYTCLSLNKPIDLTNYNTALFIADVAGWGYGYGFKESNTYDSTHISWSGNNSKTSATIMHEFDISNLKGEYYPYIQEAGSGGNKYGGSIDLYAILLFS